ncbi:MAG: NAD(P)H-dependent oxidoreductase subunit E [Planctomycetota bacterium]|jgi:NADH:ubiquinone oxidoreductase subunit F (NADH-binding)
MNLIEELYALQEAHGYLREEDLRDLSRRIKTPLYEIEGVASFYPHFRRTPAPRVTVSACRDLVCHMADGGAALRALRDACAGRDDVEFHEVSCLGRCDRAPSCTVNDVPTFAEEVSGHIDDLATLPNNDPTRTPRRWPVDPHESSSKHYSVLMEYLKSRDIDGLIEKLKGSGLRGMGGAGFPTGVKWDLVRKERGSTKYVVCNADESEPGTFKDRVCMEELPWLVIEGIMLGALTVGADEGWFYIRHEYVKEASAIRRGIQKAYADGLLGDNVLGTGWSFHLKMFVSPGGYILGEETALLEALEGKRGEPRNKPPYPGTQGLHGKPTLINNVESFAMVPYLLRTGTQDHKFFSVSGDVNTPGVHCAPKGTTLNQLIEMCGGMKDGKSLLAFLPGGASTRFLPASRADIVMDWKELAEAGSSLGSGAVVIVGEGRDMLELAQNLTAFFRNESCGKCVPCRIGTEKAVTMIDGRKADDLGLLPELHETLLETSICGLGQAALNPILSVLENFAPQDE